MNPDLEQSEIIQAFVEKPKYDSRNRGPLKKTEDAMLVVEECLKLNETRRAKGLHKQQMKKIDIHEYLLKKGYNISYSTVKCLLKELDERSREAFICQEYEYGDISEFDWGTVKLDMDGTGYKNYQMAVFAAAKTNFRFAKLYKSQDTPAFQESHADYFSHCHGVFHTMVYDNMRVAVRKFVGLHEKEPTEALHQSTASLQSDTRIKKIFETYYSSDAKIFPPTGPRERLASLAYEELSTQMCSLLSYRHADNLMNQMLHREQTDLVHLKTLSDFIERKGSELENFRDDFTKETLEQYGFDPKTALLDRKMSRVLYSKTMYDSGGL